MKTLKLLLCFLLLTSFSLPVHAEENDGLSDDTEIVEVDESENENDDEFTDETIEESQPEIVEEETTEEDSAEEEIVEEDDEADEDEVVDDDYGLNPSKDVDVNTDKETEIKFIEDDDPVEVEEISEEETVDMNKLAGAKTGKSLKYRISMMNRNYWQPAVSDGQTAGTTGESRALDLIQVALSDELLSEGDIAVKVFSNHIWQGEVTNGNTVGVVDQKLQAVQISLVGALADQYNIVYRTHVSNIGWQDWVKNGDTAGTLNTENAIEAIEIYLQEKANIDANELT